MPQATSGRSNQKVEPSPSTLSKPSSPPCASTISRDSASPIPVPAIELPLRGVDAEELREQLVLLLGGDAEAVIAHRDAYTTLARPGRELHVSSRRAST